MKSVVHRHRRDIFGLSTVVAGLLTGAAVWVSQAGRVGELIEDFLAYMFGLIRLAVPIGLIALGVVILQGRRMAARSAETQTQTRAQSKSKSGDITSADPDSTRAQQSAEETPPDPLARISVGGGLILMAALGLLHIGRASPEAGAGSDELNSAGGAVGAIIGGKLHDWTALWGSVLVLVLIAAIGVVVLTQLTVRSVAAGVMVALRPVGRVALSGMKQLIQSLFGDLNSTHPAKDGKPADVSGHPTASTTPLPDATNTGSGPFQPAAARSTNLNPTSQGRQGSHASNGQTVPQHGSSPGPSPAGSEAQIAANPNVSTAIPSGRNKSASSSHTKTADSSGTTTAGSSGTGHVIRPAANTKASESKWRLPPLSLLSGNPLREVNATQVHDRAKLLQSTLNQFGVPTVLLDPVVGPTVTRFVLELGDGVKVAKLENLRKDIAYAMASPDVRILAPIPGQQAIGVEVPNLDRQIVALGDVLRSPEARAADHPLEFAVGRDINGHSIMMNLAAMPHLLIAGATGAGKSSCLNSIISSILTRSTPEDVRMILVDPKRVEMGQYDRIPHLLTAPVTDPRKAANALSWAVREMDRRYDTLHETGFRDITGYNVAVNKGELKPLPGRKDSTGEPLRYVHMPFVLVVVDELANLMMVAARDVEESIARLAQMARAVGIHLVIATQRPSVNVITGIIKANIPARFAFAVSSNTDSRVILDQSGADRLVGKGDMLLIGPASSIPQRVQGCWVTEKEVRDVVAWWVDQAPEFHDDPSVAITTEGIQGSLDIQDSLDKGKSAVAVRGSDTSITADPAPKADADDELLEKAMELVVQSQLGSTSMLQRKLRVGFARAGRIMDLLEQRGVVGPSIGSKAREVLISADEAEARNLS